MRRRCFRHNGTVIGAKGFAGELWLGITVSARLGLAGEGHSSGPRCISGDCAFLSQPALIFLALFLPDPFSMGNAAWRNGDKF